MRTATEQSITDLSQLNTREAAERGFELELRSPFSGSPLGMFIGVIGHDSKKYQNHQREVNDRRMQKQIKARGKWVASEEENEADAIERLVIATSSFRTVTRSATEDGTDVSSAVLNFKGKALPFTPDNARSLYEDPDYVWIREQVAEAVFDRGNFSPKSSGS